jgi:signal transduction histidine kinase
VLPGVLPFVVPSLAAIGLGVSGATYLAGILPAGISSEVPSPLVDPYRIISGMVAQVGALFLVDLLAQLLARRVHDQRILTSELLDQLGEGVLVVDRQERLLYANLEFWRLFNLEQRMFPGTTASDIFDRTHLREVLDVLRHGELPAWSRLTTPDQRHLTIRVGALIGRRGRRLGRTVTVVDETRLRHLEDDAARGARLAALGEMAAGIAHEVRNPLASLRGCAQELAGITCSTGQDDTRVLAGILTGEADRLGRIIDDFLALSRLRGPDMRPIHLPPLMQEIEAEIRHRDDLPASFEIECSCSADIGPIRGDVDQLRQILLNLCKNALDAIADGDGLRLGISARASHGEDEFLDRPAVTICIEDDGCGIAPESLEQVFTPFYSTKSRGTGLGLTLVQRMVHQHGGTMRIDSQPGQGTTVRLVMPRA